MCIIVFLIYFMQLTWNVKGVSKGRSEAMVNVQMATNGSPAAALYGGYSHCTLMAMPSSLKNSTLALRRTESGGESEEEMLVLEAVMLDEGRSEDGVGAGVVERVLERTAVLVLADEGAVEGAKAEARSAESELSGCGCAVAELLNADASVDNRSSVFDVEFLLLLLVLVLAEDEEFCGAGVDVMPMDAKSMSISSLSCTFC